MWKNSMLYPNDIEYVIPMDKNPVGRKYPIRLIWLCRNSNVLCNEEKRNFNLHWNECTYVTLIWYWKCTKIDKNRQNIVCKIRTSYQNTYCTICTRNMHELRCTFLTHQYMAERIYFFPMEQNCTNKFWAYSSLGDIFRGIFPPMFWRIRMLYSKSSSEWKSVTLFQEILAHKKLCILYRHPCLGDRWTPRLSE